MRKIILLICLAVIQSSAASADVIGMLYVGSKDNASFGIEKTTSGEMFFLLDIDNNPSKAEYVFSLGNPLDSSAVTYNEGKPLLVLSVYNGSEHGFLNSKKVKLDKSSHKNRTTQRSQISQDIISLSKSGKLKDKDGTVYSSSDIKGIIFIYQIEGEYDSSLDGKVIFFDSLKNGEKKQLAGKVTLLSLDSPPRED